MGVALVTPFNQNGSVDYPALEKILEFVIKGGADFLVSLGTTGETPTLDENEKKEIISFTIDKAQGKVPVVVGIGGYNTREIIRSIENFPIKNAAAILSTSPYYSKPSQQGLYEHYKTIAESSPKPILIYNVPGRTGRNVNAETTLKLAENCPNIQGIKEASGNLEQCMKIVSAKANDFLVLSGDDGLSLAQVACGMDGVISVAGNNYPKTMSTIMHLCLEGKFKEARSLHYRLLPAYSYMFEENNPAGVKYFMNKRGLLNNYFRLPLVSVSKSLEAKIDDFISKNQDLT